MADTLQTLIDKIPNAVIGEHITVAYHNSLRDAIKELAKHTGGGPVTSQGTFSFPPTLLPLAGENGWTLGQGFARLPLQEELPQGADRSAAGWMALQLPDGFRITGMIVRGSLVATNDPDFDVRILLQIIGSTTTRNLAVATPSLANILPNTGGLFLAPAQIVGAAEDLIVKNTQFQYLVRARVRQPTPDLQASILSIQVQGSPA